MLHLFLMLIHLTIHYSSEAHRNAWVEGVQAYLYCSLTTWSDTCRLLIRLAHAEASFMDPQSRILLEQTHLALADAGAAAGQPVPSNSGV